MLRLPADEFDRDRPWHGVVVLRHQARRRRSQSSLFFQRRWIIRLRAVHALRYQPCQHQPQRPPQHGGQRAERTKTFWGTVHGNTRVPHICSTNAPALFATCVRCTPLHFLRDARPRHFPVSHHHQLAELFVLLRCRSSSLVSRYWICPSSK